MTNATDFRSRDHALLAGQILFPFTVFAAYGVYRTIIEGLPTKGWPNGSILLAGAILSFLCLCAYVKADETDKGQRSLLMAIAGFSLMVPYVYCLYIIFYVGIWSLIQLVTIGFTISGFLIGVLAVLMGYRSLNALHRMSELMKIPTSEVRDKEG